MSRDSITANRPFYDAYCSKPTKPTSAVKTTESETDKVLEFHPVANIFPMLSDVELDSLATDIKANGLQVPIVLSRGLILDGRNRYLACRKAGVKIKTVEYTGTTPTAYVFSMNEKRRHLTQSERAAIAVQAMPEYSKAAKTRKAAGIGQNCPMVRKGKATELVAEDFNVSPRYVADTKTIKEKSPEMFDQIKSGEVTMSEAKKKLAPANPKAGKVAKKRKSKEFLCPHCGKAFTL